MALKDVFFVFFVSASVIPYCLAVCYFPDYLRGEYSVQSTNSLPGQIKYNAVSIGEEAVSLWGYCNKKIGNGLYLIDSFNGTYCLRCFHISVKSQNIVVIKLAGHTDRCFVSSQAAESSCPKPDQLETARQIILFKSKEEIRKENCPINGRYAIHYRQNKPDYPIECNSRSSLLDTCPVGSELNIRFRDCHFENHDLLFECLGSWEGPHQQRYLALFDTRIGAEPRPQYRCGLYREDPGSGTVYIAFSSDSTCITDLHNSQSGFETLVLTKIPPRFPLQLAADRGCRFPSWTEGRWELVNVQGKIFTYTDPTLFKKYTFQCIENDDGRERNYAYSVEERVLVVGRTECDEEFYTCVWLKKRGENVFEFQLATETSQYPNNSLCSDQNFKTNVWITQGRKDVSTVSPCPILGEYIGMLPNVENLCAKLSSDCVSQDTMYYVVSDCSQVQIFEGSHSRPYYPRRQTRQVNQNETSAAEKNDTFTETTTSSPPTPDTASDNASVANLTTTPTPMPSTTQTDSAKSNTSTTESNVSSSTPAAPIEPPPTKQGHSPMEPSAAEASASERVLAQDNYQTSSEISVGSYYAENRNFGELPRDIRLLPAPISSSTISPYGPYRRTYPAAAPITQNYYQYEQPPPAAGARYSQYTNYRDDRRYQNDYWQRTDYRNYPPAGWNQTQNHQIPQGNQMNQVYLTDPMNSYRPAPVSQNIYALPPIQLPPAPSTYRPVYPSRRQNIVPFFKEREYRCLGQWQENNVTYTFTQRKDIGTYECFVGTTISEFEISVREAGKYCERSMNPMMPEMRLSRKNSCAESHPNTAVFTPTTQTSTVPVTTTKYTANRRIQHTTRPWRPLNVTNRPPPSLRNKNGTPSDSTKIVPSHLVLLCILHVLSLSSFYIAFTNF